MPKFLQARVISLETSVDRRRLVAENLKDFQIPWRFFDALRGDDHCVYLPDEKNQIVRFGRNLTNSEIGCFKSHVTAMSEFETCPDLKWLLVIEDDVWVDTLFDFKALAEWLESQGINYLRLYARRWKSADVVAYWNDRQFIRFKTDPYGAQAYLINRAGAEAFRRSFKSIDMPIDDELGRFWLHGLEIYALFPFPVIERAATSTLQSDRSLMPVPNAGFRRQLVRAFDYLLKARANVRSRLLGHQRFKHSVRDNAEKTKL